MMAKVDDKPNATPSANEGDKTQNAEIKELKATNQQLLQSNQQFQRQIDELKGTIISPQFQEFMKAKNQPGQFSPSDFAAGRQEVDLETMDNTQLAKYIMDGVTRTIQNTVSPQIDKISVDMTRDQLIRGIKDTKAKYKDYDNYVAQMSQTAARIEKSGITAEDIYKITKHPGAGDGSTKPPDGGDKTEPPTPGAGGELKATADKETPKQTAGRIYDELKIELGPKE